MVDYYQILEVSRVASTDEIKTAFRTLAFKYHPDKNAGNRFATAKFREIQEAYEVLSNPGIRKEYDEFLRVSNSNTTPMPPDTNRSYAQRPPSKPTNNPSQGQSTPTTPNMLFLLFQSIHSTIKERGVRNIKEYELYLTLSQYLDDSAVEYLLNPSC